MKKADVFMRDRARNLRKTLTEAEKLLWGSLRRRQIKGIKFRRQYLIGSYIVDFVCHSKKIIVEVDGHQHMVQIEYDIIRTKFLEAKGYKVLRFWNNEIFLNLKGVLEIIWFAVSTSSPPPQPSPAKRGRDLESG